MIFHPKTFVKQFGELKLDGFRLSNDEFLEYGEQVTKVRADIGNILYTVLGEKFNTWVKAVIDQRNEKIKVK